MDDCKRKANSLEIKRLIENLRKQKNSQINCVANAPQTTESSRFKYSLAELKRNNLTSLGVQLVENYGHKNKRLKLDDCPRNVQSHIDNYFSVEKKGTDGRSNLKTRTIDILLNTLKTRNSQTTTTSGTYYLSNNSCTEKSSSQNNFVQANSDKTGLDTSAEVIRKTISNWKKNGSKSKLLDSKKQLNVLNFFKITNVNDANQDNGNGNMVNIVNNTDKKLEQECYSIIKRQGNIKSMQDLRKIKKMHIDNKSSVTSNNENNPKSMYHFAQKVHLSGKTYLPPQKEEKNVLSCTLASKNEQAGKKSFDEVCKLLLDKENIFFQKSRSTGNVAIERRVHNCEAQNSLPITDSEIKITKERLEKNKGTLDDIMESIRIKIKNCESVVNVKQCCGNIVNNSDNSLPYQNNLSKKPSQVEQMIGKAKDSSCSKKDKYKEKNTELSQGNNYNIGVKKNILAKTVRGTTYCSKNLINSCNLENNGFHSANYNADFSQINIKNVSGPDNVNYSVNISGNSEKGEHKSENFLTYLPTNGVTSSPSLNERSLKTKSMTIERKEETDVESESEDFLTYFTENWTINNQFCEQVPRKKCMEMVKSETENLSVAHKYIENKKCITHSEELLLENDLNDILGKNCNLERANSTNERFNTTNNPTETESASTEFLDINCDMLNNDLMNHGLEEDTQTNSKQCESDKSEILDEFLERLLKENALKKANLSKVEVNQRTVCNQFCEQVPRKKSVKEVKSETEHLSDPHKYIGNKKFTPQSEELLQVNYLSDILGKNCNLERANSANVEFNTTNDPTETEPASAELLDINCNSMLNNDLMNHGLEEDTQTNSKQCESGKSEILDEFFEQLLKESALKQANVTKVEGNQGNKCAFKKYRKGKIKIYRIRKLKKTTSKIKIAKPVNENLSFDNLFKKFTQDVVESDHSFSRTESTSSVSTTSSYISDLSKSEILSTGSNELTSPQQRLRKSINELSKDQVLLPCGNKEEYISDHNKDELKMKIQQVFLKVAADFTRKNNSSLKFRRQSFDNCIFKDNRLQLKPPAESSMTVINSASQRSQIKFKLILYIMKKVQTLLETDTKLTKRELYYQLKTVVNDQRVIDRVINAVSCLLNVGMWSLNIIAQKGLVFGNLKILLSSGEALNCNIPGTLIPQDVNEIVEIQSNAYFILVVEKESIFYKLIEEGLPDKLTRPFILITGKGFPDLNTQLFLKKLWGIMSIPVFILVDADPHGINIMLNYRFGSVNNAHVSHHLAVPNAKWLGIYPSEVTNLNATRELLSEREVKLVNHLLNTPYVNSNPRIASELKVLLEKQYKAGIEGLIKTDVYLSDVYLPNKFFSHNFI